MKKKRKIKPKPEPPKKRKKLPVKPHIVWGKINSKGGAALQGTGSQTGCNYKIFLNRGNKTWKVVRPEKGEYKKKFASGIKELVDAKKRALMWERQGPETEEKPVPAPIPANKFVNLPPPDKMLRDRNPDDLKPVFKMFNLVHNIGGMLQLTHVGEFPMRPRKINLIGVCEYLEDLIDLYESHGLWLTNSAILSWEMTMRQGYWRTLPRGEQDALTTWITRAVRHRDEPEEWSDRVRIQDWIRQEREKDMAKISAKTESKKTNGKKSKTNDKKKKSPEKPKAKPSNGKTQMQVVVDEKKTVTIAGGKKVTIRSKITESDGGTRRIVISHNGEEFGLAETLRWMGDAGFKKSHARRTMDALGLDEVKDSTIGVKIYNGQGGGAGGDIPEIPKEMGMALKKLGGMDGNKSPSKEPKTKPSNGKKTNGKKKPAKKPMAGKKKSQHDEEE